MPNLSQFRIKSITFNDQSTVALSSVTIFVGPNNAGKSRALKDVALRIDRSDRSDRAQQGVIVTAVDLDGPNSWAEVLQVLPDPPELSADGSGFTFSTLNLTLDKAGFGGMQWGGSGQSAIDQVDRALNDSRSDGLKMFLPAATMHLTTDTRLSLLKDCKAPNDANKPRHLMEYLYRGGTKVEVRIATEMKRYFGKEIRLDISNPLHLAMRYSKEFKDVPSDPRDALGPMGRRQLLSDQGDGVRSFATVVASLKALNRPVCLIDEPEAFLHPPQALHLGRILGEYASNSRQVLVATHSSDVVRGILSAIDTVQIVRIDRQENANSFRRIEDSTIKEILADPLLSSARVFEGLFYSSVVVVEADSDARFFEAAVRRIDNELDTHFVAAENKQTVAKILRMYASMGVRHIGIVDFDMLHKRDEFTAAMNSIGVPNDKAERLLEIRDDIAREADQSSPMDRLKKLDELVADMRTQIDESLSGSLAKPLEQSLSNLQRRASEAANVTKPWKVLKEKGRNGLTETAKSQFDELNSILIEYGLCIYPLGELESSLAEMGLKYTTNKREWIVSALTMIASLEVDSSKEFWAILLDLIHRRIRGNGTSVTMASRLELT